MSDTLPPVVLSDDWINLNDATGIPNGTDLVLQVTGGNPAVVASGSVKPDSSIKGWNFYPLQLRNAPIGDTIWAKTSPKTPGTTIQVDTTDNFDGRVDAVHEPPQSRTAFGEASVESLSPITQISAHFGLLTNVLSVVDDASSGTSSVTDGMYTCETGASPDGLSSITTLRQLAYKAGQGGMARFTALFDTPAPSNLQAAGLITAENGFTFGYMGENFGIIYNHDGHNELLELTLVQAASNAEVATVTINDISYPVSLSGVGSTEGDAYEISESLKTQVPNYNFSSNGSQVVAQAVLPEPHGAFGYTSLSSVGTFVRLVDGQDSVQDFYPQSLWSEDTRISQNPDINLNPQTGNVYQIQFQYLGFGDIRFFVEDKETGDFVLVHVIKYANTYFKPSVTNPTFRVGWLSRNVGNTSSIKVQGGSAAAFIEGDIIRDTSARSDSNDQPLISNDLTNILAIRNRISFADKVNRADFFPQVITASSQTNRVAFFRLLLNPVFVDPVVFEYADKGGSIIETSKDASIVSGGTEVGTLTVVAGSSSILRFDNRQVSAITPGSIIVIAAEIPQGSAADCQASITLQEDL